MGVGKTRVGMQVCKALSGSIINDFAIRAGFVSNPSFLGEGYTGAKKDMLQNIQCLAEVLTVAFFPKVSYSNIDLATVIRKLRIEFGSKVAVVLHVDEYLVNVKAMNALVYGAVSALTDPEFNFRVALVLTGMKPVVGVHNLELGSRFTLKSHLLSPLPTDQVKQRIGAAVGIAPDVEWDYKLDTLVEMCGGYPASLVALLNELKRVEDQDSLKTKGLVSLSHARSVYANLQTNLEDRYGELRWLELLYPNIPATERYLSVESTNLLCRVVLYSMAAFPVKRGDSILPSKDLTYAKLEESGLVVLTKADAQCVIWMPHLAVVLVSNRLKLVDWEMLGDPFSVSFQVQERLALASLSLRLRVLTEASSIKRGINDAIPQIEN